MVREIDKTVCIRCGEEVYRRSISIENLYKYDTSNKDAYIKTIMQLEDVSNDVAKSWAEHGLFENCIEKIRLCPECGSQLKTWRASICVKCGAKFESLYKEKGT